MITRGIYIHQLPNLIILTVKTHSIKEHEHLFEVFLWFVSILRYWILKTELSFFSVLLISLLPSFFHYIFLAPPPSDRTILPTFTATYQKVWCRVKHPQIIKAYCDMMHLILSDVISFASHLPSRNVCDGNISCINLIPNKNNKKFLTAFGSQESETLIWKYYVEMKEAE